MLALTDQKQLLASRAATRDYFNESCLPHRLLCLIRKQNDYELYCKHIAADEYVADYSQTMYA